MMSSAWPVPCSPSLARTPPYDVTSGNSRAHAAVDADRVRGETGLDPAAEPAGASVTLLEAALASTESESASSVSSGSGFFLAR